MSGATSKLKVAAKKLINASRFLSALYGNRMNSIDILNYIGRINRSAITVSESTRINIDYSKLDPDVLDVVNAYEEYVSIDEITTNPDFSADNYKVMGEEMGAEMGAEMAIAHQECPESSNSIHFIHPIVDPNYMQCGYVDDVYEPIYEHKDTKIPYPNKIPYFPIPSMSPSSIREPRELTFYITCHGDLYVSNENEIFTIFHGPKLILNFAVPFGNANLIGPYQDSHIFNLGLRMPEINSNERIFVDMCEHITSNVFKTSDFSKTYKNDESFKINTSRNKTVYCRNNVYLNKTYIMNETNENPLIRRANNFNFGLYLFGNNCGLPNGIPIDITFLFANKYKSVSLQAILDNLTTVFNLQEHDTVYLYDVTCNPFIFKKNERLNRIESRYYEDIVSYINSGDTFDNVKSFIQARQNASSTESHLSHKINKKQKKQYEKLNDEWFRKQMPVSKQNAFGKKRRATQKKRKLKKLKKRKSQKK